MSNESSDPQEDAAAQAPEPAVQPAARLPRWLILAQIGAVALVSGVIVLAIVLLRRDRPAVLHVDSAASSVKAATAPHAAAPPLPHPDGPLGALEPHPPSVGQPAPDFALLDTEGRRVELASLRGKAVVVNFWATWCGPCKQEFPELEKANETLGNDVVILALDQAESVSKVSAFRDQFGAGFTILMDSDNAVADAFRFNGIPDTVFIDRNGIVRDVVLGPLSAGTFRYKITQTLNAK
ncbi:MAG TPA: TlpA disulfide reductase family protein [Dehalococcoidia bacterium]|nr:TlpA disulfide reductase family protein [Dehalococcoidia bacterium]